MKKNLLFLFVLLPALVFSQAETLKILNNWRMYSNVQNALYDHYLNQVENTIDKRQADIAKLKTKADWQKRQIKIKKILSGLVDPFPPKTPLNAKITGTIKRDGYRIEKVVFESRPKFFVTAALYLPDNIKGKVPAVLLPTGHVQSAFRADFYQRSCINLVKKGFVVLTFDPIGQGERVQYYSSETGKSLVGGAVAEHMYAGLQTLLTGKGMPAYFIWDGIRALDYLISRKEVDPQRIAVTGNSGGGEQAMFFSVYDERIAITAPSCFVTGMRRLFESIGPQDAEQNLYHFLWNGLDFADLLVVRIPKPAILLTNSRDFFSVQGAMETEKEVKKVYEIFGVGDRFRRSEDNYVHGITPKNREARHNFFQTHFDFPGDSTDHEVQYLTKALQITKTGQVSTALGSISVFDINKKAAEKEMEKLNQSRKNIKAHLKSVKSAAKELCGYIAPEKIDNSVITGRYVMNGYRIERRIINGENGDYPIPFLLFLPDKIKGPAVIYLDEAGKSKEDKANDSVINEIHEDIKWLLEHGHPVISADLLGFGEMKQRKYLYYSFGDKFGKLDYGNFFAGIQLGRSLVGIQTGDIERLVKYAKNSSWYKGRKVYGIAKGELLAVSLMHAAAISGDFSNLLLINPLISYCSVVMNKFYRSNPNPPFVGAALTAYDLPDLIAAAAPNKVAVINPLDQMGRPAADSVIDEDYGFIKNFYASLKAADKLRIEKIEQSQINENSFLEWLTE